jgi:phospholipase C
MSYSVAHVYVDLTASSTIVTRADGTKRAQFRAGGDFGVRYPGRLIVLAEAEYSILMNPLPSPDPHTHQPPPKPTVHHITLSTTIFTPDGLEFTGTHVTREDIERFRDLREVSQGAWRYATFGTSGEIPISDDDGRILSGPGSVWIAVEETVTSQSAGLLVSSSGGTALTHIYSFDLFRVGQFVAKVSLPGGNISPTATLRLMDPDGTIVASGHGTLTFEVSLRSLDKSRDPGGNVRRWSLEFVTTDLNLDETVTATVIATARVPLGLLQNRIDELLGPNGEKVLIYGQNANGRALARLQFRDEFTAGTFDVDDLLDAVLKKVKQDPGAEYSNLQANIAYNLANYDEDWHGLTLDVGAMSVSILRVKVGPSTHLSPPIPAITIDVGVHGDLALDVEGFTFASMSLKDGWLTLEVGMELNSSGEIELRAWVIPDPIRVYIRWELKVLLALVSPLAALTEAELEQMIQVLAYEILINGFRNILQQMFLSVPKLMAMLLGGYFTLTSLRIENETLVFDYVAPTEPDPKPNPSYTGVIGRSVIQVETQGWKLFPKSLGDTWAAQTLTEKIDHIVIVMMENRSFDHVLGYRGALPGENGLSPDLLNFLSGQGFGVHELRMSDIASNAAHLKTRFPLSVGHHFKDVAEQLADRLAITPDGPTINSPLGFVDNFVKNHPHFNDVTEIDGVVKEDVLGFYTGNDLAFYKFLAENYAYSDRYFSSHPGPTLPNRMFSLAGDLQYDRVGEAVLDNSNDNFSLSRALNIFDVLTRKNVSWRVYESFPSVTMLRMFARYLGNNTNISAVSTLRTHLANDDFPAVVFIDPAMHSAPQTDDHPVADMLRGQMFLKDIYDTLRANEEMWLRTLLIITYDEHGGFYDHVVPPIADARALLEPVVSGGPQDAVPSMKGPITVAYGVRVPTFVVSPWVAPGRGPEVVLDHCSVLKTILARFCGRERPFLSDRVAASHSFEPFLTQAMPRLSEIPPSPTLPSLHDEQPKRPGRIITRAVSRQALRNGTVDFHDLTGMVARILGRN